MCRDLAPLESLFLSFDLSSIFDHNRRQSTDYAPHTNFKSVKITRYIYFDYEAETKIKFKYFDEMWGNLAIFS